MFSDLNVSASADATMVVIEFYMNFLKKSTSAIAPNHDMAPEVPFTPTHEQLTRDKRLQVPTAKTPRRQPNWLKTNIRKVVAITAVFFAAFSATKIFPADAKKFTHHSGTTIYGDVDARIAFAGATKRYLTLWKNTGNVINIPEHQYMDIFFSR